MKKHSGFTLVELMITIAIVGILLMVGLPSLKSSMQGSQLIATSNELLSALHLARSEAIKRNARVSICSSSNGAACSVSADWKNGWIVFVDAVGPGDLVNTGEACVAEGEDCLLRIHAGFTDSKLTVSGVNTNNTAITSFTFTSRGLPKAAGGASQSGTFNICVLDEAGTNTIASRAVILSLAGRVRVSDNAGANTCPTI